LNNLKISHIGIVTDNIEKYLQNSFIEKKSPILEDPNQHIKICYIDNLEIIQPTSEKSPVYAFLQKTKGGLHHICFEINDYSKLQTLINQKKIIPLSSPSPLFNDPTKTSLWALSKNKELLEFVYISAIRN